MRKRRFFFIVSVKTLKHHIRRVFETCCTFGHVRKSPKRPMAPTRELLLRSSALRPVDTFRRLVSAENAVDAVLDDACQGWLWLRNAAEPSFLRSIRLALIPVVERLPVKRSNVKLAIFGLNIN